MATRGGNMIFQCSLLCFTDCLATQSTIKNPIKPHMAKEIFRICKQTLKLGYDRPKCFHFRIKSKNNFDQMKAAGQNGDRRGRWEAATWLKRTIVLGNKFKLSRSVYWTQLLIGHMSTKGSEHMRWGAIWAYAILVNLHISTFYYIKILL